MKLIISRTIKLIISAVLSPKRPISTESKLLLLILALILLLLSLVACSYTGSVRSDLRYHLAPSEAAHLNDGHARSIDSPQPSLDLTPRAALPSSTKTSYASRQEKTDHDRLR